jgi:hypothetical protein
MSWFTIPLIVVLWDRRGRLVRVIAIGSVLPYALWTSPLSVDTHSY